MTTTLEGGVLDLLEANAGVTALIGAGATARIYPLVVPEGAVLPAITWQLISEPRMESMNGGTVLAWTRLQFNCWARKYSQAAPLAQAVKAALSQYRGTLSNGSRVDRIKVDNTLDLYDPATGYFRRVVDVIVTNEAAA